MEEDKKTCPDCGGTGSIDFDFDIPCPTCDGTGKVPADYKSWITRFLESKD